MADAIEQVARALLAAEQEHGARLSHLALARTAYLATLRAIREPSDQALVDARNAAREVGLLPAYTDKGGPGQPPIFHVVFREAWQAAIDKLISEVSGE